jgi:deoxyribodipyrimidine photolyase-related protein
MSAPLRHLVVVLGDQLDEDSAAFDGFDAACDAVWMCESPAEATYVWSHKARIALFLSAMRHFAATQERHPRRVIYHATGSQPQLTLGEALGVDLERLKPSGVIVVEPGEWRLAQDLERVCRAAKVELVVRDDLHFFCPRRDFADWMRARRQPRLEHFYRWQRQATGLLMDGREPVGGQWNFDQDNRESFGKQGPGRVPAYPRFAPDTTTQTVLDLVSDTYAGHPGSLASFDWPVTRADALKSLDDFVAHRLADFGPFQDALWDTEATLWHSRLSAALNLKLLNPREVCAAAIAAYRDKQAPLASVEGFVRQILGWREFARGLYWHRMPQYLDDNSLDAQQDLPPFYWTGDTEMNCLRVTIGDTLAHGYAHHIQRLMVTGLFALLYGVQPRQVHQWYLAVYVDAVEWVELPNTIGMSQHADGGLMGSKPYIASGKYIDRMSNYCSGCRFDPAQSTGATACPFTTLYWDFLARHQKTFAAHPRLKMQVRNLERMDEKTLATIRAAATKLRETLSSRPEQ